MPIEIQAPLAAQLFALGSNTGSQGQDKFNYKGNRPGGFHQGALMQAPPLPSEDHSGGQSKALASVAGALASAYAGGGTSSTPDANGNGFGLGGTLVKGDMGEATYAGDTKPGILERMMGPKEDTTSMPVDNKTTPQNNPYALNYSNAQQRKPSLFSYGSPYY